MGKNVTTGVSTKGGNNIKTQKITRRVRLIFYGGSKVSADNSAFEFAAKNIMKDYKNVFPHAKIIWMFVDSAKDVVDKINEQPTGKIDSLDLLFHGTERGLHMYKGASMQTGRDFNAQKIEDDDLNASLYAGRIRKWLGDDKCDEARAINDIDFTKFAIKDAIIEIHGCKSGNDTDPLTDSITKNLSQALPEGYVIGHTDKASPKINGDKTAFKDQDYRHGPRNIWHNGKIIKKSNKKGMLTLKDLICAD